MSFSTVEAALLFHHIWFFIFSLLITSLNAGSSTFILLWWSMQSYLFTFFCLEMFFRERSEGKLHVLIYFLIIKGDILWKIDVKYMRENSPFCNIFKITKC